MAIILAGSESNQAKQNPETLDYSYERPVFTKDEFVEKLMKLLTDEEYTNQAMRMRMMSRMGGGPSKAVAAIENAFLSYTAGHMIKKGENELLEATSLIDDSLNKASEHSNWFECGFCFFILIPGVILWLILDGFEGLLNVGRQE